jgi:anti-sigma regulatory factor (Ser/Thr protein kinase)
LTTGGIPLGTADVLDGRVMAAWPLCSHLELGALPSAVPCARLHARQVLWEWGLTELSESIELVVSELVTNAVHASREKAWRPVVRLWLLSDKSRVLVLVWDGSPTRPVRITADERAESGWGLLLVESISDQWNWFQPAGHEGKVVWAEVSAAGLERRWHAR